MKNTKSILLGAAALVLSALPSQAAIVIGDFSTDYDGWLLVGDGNNLQYYSSERVESGGIWYLRDNFQADEANQYPGWTGLSKTWDSSFQEGVTQFTMTMMSSYPWKVEVLASFAGLGEIAAGAVFWPGNPTAQEYTFTNANFNITADQFNGIEGIRITMDASSATNGGSNGGGSGPMYYQIGDVQLNGTAIPEPSSIALIIGGTLFMLFLVRKRRLVA